MKTREELYEELYELAVPVLAESLPASTGQPLTTKLKGGEARESNTQAVLNRSGENSRGGKHLLGGGVSSRPTQSSPPHLPRNPSSRKRIPLATGVLDYFPDALIAVAEVSFAGNEQHSPGEPIHWDRSKSQDEADALLRHLIDRGNFDTDGIRHTAKVAWRALALLQKELESKYK